jgi:flagellar biosynthesis protein FlhA
MRNKLHESILGIGVIFIIVIIVVPMIPTVLDFLFILNIMLALTILLTTLYVKETLSFSSFPTVLLIATLFRLSLNISSTRLILSNGGEAGKIIETFGSFVIGGNVVVGLIVFLIIIIIQFIVITKGAERVSEVTARFTLDSMPGKQMAIDADLNAGLIDEKQAKQRRKKVESEASFYGSMDGASKFVKGDAIAGIIITIINLVGGIIIGMVSGDMELRQVAEVYSMAAVGDGLVSQIPALLISTATAIITTRSASENSLNTDLIKQLFSQSTVLLIAGFALVMLSFVPGLPRFALIGVGGTLLVLGYNLFKTEGETEKAKEIAQTEGQKAPIPTKTKVDIMTLLNVDPITLEFGYSLIPLIDEAQGGDLLDRMVMIRQQCASKMGMVIPVVRFLDNLKLKSNEYMIKINDIAIEGGEVLADHLLAMNAMNMSGDGLEGIETVERAFGMPAKWIRKKDRDKAEMHGYTVIPPSSVVATHLAEVIKRHSHELLGREEVQNLLNNLKKKHTTLVEEVVPKTVSVGIVQKVLAGLLQEGLSIRNLKTIIEALGDYGKMTQSINMLIEYVRQALKREITNQYVNNGRIDVITVSAEIEDTITKSIRKGEIENFLSLDPQSIKTLLGKIEKELKRVGEMGIDAVILTAPVVRIYLKELSLRIDPNLTILSYNELENNVNIQVVGNI